MKQYPIVDFLDKMGFYHEADFVEDQLIREASKKNYWPLLLPYIHGQNIVKKSLKNKSTED